MLARHRLKVRQQQKQSELQGPPPMRGSASRRWWDQTNSLNGQPHEHLARAAFTCGRQARLRTLISGRRNLRTERTNMPSGTKSKLVCRIDSSSICIKTGELEMANLLTRGPVWNCGMRSLSGI